MYILRSFSNSNIFMHILWRYFNSNNLSQLQFCSFFDGLRKSRGAKVTNNHLRHYYLTSRRQIFPSLLFFPHEKSSDKERDDWNQSNITFLGTAGERECFARLIETITIGREKQTISIHDWKSSMWLFTSEAGVWNTWAYITRISL